MKKIIEIYNRLNKSNLYTLHDIYTDDILFIDPVHEINGIEHLKSYFSALYKEIDEVNFKYSHCVQSTEEGYIQWEMTFSHPRLRKGRPVILPGATYMSFNASGKATLHRDYYDLGAMLYEQLPLLGFVISGLKKRLRV